MNRERTINQMLKAFWSNEPLQIGGLDNKTTLPVAGQGLGEGKTALGLNLQKQLSNPDFPIDPRFKELRERLLDAAYVRVVMNDGI